MKTNVRGGLHHAMQLTLLAIIVLLSQNTFAQTPVTATIGTGTSAASANALLSTSTTSNRYSRTLSIYTAAELTAAGAVPGNIISVAWYKDGTGEYTTADAELTIYMKSTTAATFSGDPVTWATEVAGATQVYSNTMLSLPTGTGYKTFTLTTPFVWNGTSNVEILVDWYRNSAPTASINWQYTAAPVSGSQATQVSSSPIPTVRYNNNRPNVQLVITPGTAPTPCAAPTNLAATASASTSASVAFTAPTPAPTSYTATYAPTAGGAATTITPAPTASPFTISGLQPGTGYTVTLVANCAGGGTSTPVTTTFTTTAAPLPCAAPTNVSTAILSSTSVSVAFTAPTPAPASYTVTYTAAGGTPVTVNPNPTVSPVVLTGLTANAAYTVSITSNCTGGTTSTAVTDMFTTPAPCNPPTNLAISNASGTSATLTFTPPTGTPAATVYLITYTPAGGTVQTVSPSPSGSPVVLTGLTPNTSYTLSVTTVCSSSQTSTAGATLTFSSGPLSSRESYAAALVSLYPNPAHGNITVQIPAELATRPVAAAMLNALGQVVWQQVLPGTAAGVQATLPLSQLAAGVYTLRLELTGGTVAKRVVVR